MQPQGTFPDRDWDSPWVPPQDRSRSVRFARGPSIKTGRFWSTDIFKESWSRRWLARDRPSSSRPRRRRETQQGRRPTEGALSFVLKWKRTQNGCRENALPSFSNGNQYESCTRVRPRGVVSQNFSTLLQGISLGAFFRRPSRPLGGTPRPECRRSKSITIPYGKQLFSLFEHLLRGARGLNAAQRSTCSPTRKTPRAN